MARAERTVKGDFQTIVKTLHDAVMNGSMFASFEEESVLSGEGYECVVRVYERYSWFGSNRVSMAVTVAGSNGIYKISAITAGGSRATFFKVNTVGEENFLSTIVGAMNSL